jgi:E3 ubiquitin-protein ligase DMA1/2
MWEGSATFAFYYVKCTGLRFCSGSRPPRYPNGRDLRPCVNGVASVVGWKQRSGIPSSFCVDDLYMARLPVHDNNTHPERESVTPSPPNHGNDAPTPSPTSSTSPSFVQRHGHSSIDLEMRVAILEDTATRNRTEPVPLPASSATASAPLHPSPPSSTNTTNNGKIAIRIVPAMDSFTRLPLRFDPIDRKVDDGEILMVGRHTDRLVQEHPNAIVFRSKVVSRNHAKLWCSAGQWYLQDVGSSSGTFLNHIRLSPASVESIPYAIKDGDIVQLGIDFRVRLFSPAIFSDSLGRRRGGL